MTYPVDVSGQVRNGGYYDAFPYKFWGYPYHARNSREGEEAAAVEQGRELGRIQSGPTSRTRQSATNPIAERPIEPKFLCFLKGNDSMEVSDVQRWKQRHGRAAEYVFVSYTSQQFRTDKEKLFLDDIGQHAARAAGVPAYWIGSSCLGDETQRESNVWRISDIIRGAHSLVVVVSDQQISGSPNPSTKAALRQWGSRMWTLPEVLLSPNSNQIQVYSQGGDINNPTRIHKRNFAQEWDDAPISRELIDHFEGSLTLSPVELITIALRCLCNREKGEYLRGDMTYALMGLLRRRPTVVPSDTAFQAFARLSLANESNMLLERLICLYPKKADQPWYDMEDQWGVSLWDVYPSIQICGIGRKDTVIIDGAFGAAIRWKAFAHVATLVADSWRRFFIRYVFRSSSYLFIVGISLLAQGTAAHSPILIGIGATLLTFALLLILMSPYLIRILYTGKIWGAQPWFFGFEGYQDISTIEAHIFGADMGHLKWSTNGSPLSVHKPNRWGECVGEDPTTVPEVAERVKRAVTAKMGEEKIFTLVDTNTLTVTLFAAVRPPVAVILCGEEGGMQRAMLCSYEWDSQTLYRESVMRMETPVLEKMSRVARFRFGMQRDGDFS